MSKRYWAISAGDEGRDYSKKFLEFGMAFVGGDKQIEKIQQVKEGDIIALKGGKSKILAVGTVISKDGKCCGKDDKKWLRDFDGWDLSGYCYVDWLELKPQKKVTGLTMGTIYEIPEANKNVVDVINDAIQGNIHTESPKRNEEPTNDDIKKVSDEEIIASLIKKGLPSSSAYALTSTLKRIKWIAQYYFHSCYWDDIREHETRTFLVIPLLLALGWSEQQIKIELPVQKTETTSMGKIDIACFKKPYHPFGQPSNNEDCVLIIETKGYKSGLDYVRSQATGYATKFKSCNAVISTNGYCYKVFQRTEGRESFEEKPFSYMNLITMNKKYPLDPMNVKGTIETIEYLLPQSHF
jgi:hypothetical protein